MELNKKAPKAYPLYQRYIFIYQKSCLVTDIVGREKLYKAGALLIYCVAPLAGVIDVALLKTFR